MKYCPKCNSEYEDDVKFCKKDGTPLETKVEKVAEGKKCPKCGKLYPEDDGFCSVCGVKLVMANARPTCTNCGSEIPEGAAFCSKCGTAIVSKNENAITCPDCNTENPSDAKFCNSCGHKFGSGLFKCAKCGKEYEKAVKFCNECGGEVLDENVDTLSINYSEAEELLKEKNIYELTSRGDIIFKNIEGFLYLAEHGDVKACAVVGIAYKGGIVLETNIDKALYFLNKSSDPLALAHLSELYIDELENPEKGFEYARKSAELGDQKGQRVLGDCYFYGMGCEEDNILAVEWYTKSAQQENTIAEERLPEAQRYLAVDYMWTDWEASFYWFKKSAELGDSISQYELGVRYYDGEGTPVNYEEAFYWSLKSAEQGHAQACYHVGCDFYYGLGVDEDEKEAIRWLDKAAAQGVGIAKELLRTITGNNYVRKYGQSSDISMERPNSWSFENHIITIKSKRIQNNSNENSGSLKIKLWYCSSVYNGGTIEGYCLGESIFSTNGLAPTYGFTDFVCNFSLTGNPPTGDYYSTITVSELYEDGNWYIVGWSNFDGTKHWNHE